MENDKQLHKINESLSKNDISESLLSSIDDYFKSLESIGPFSHKWDYQWRRQIYIFGMNFRNSRPNKVIQLLDKYISKGINSEVYDFIKSEIEYNIDPQGKEIEPKLLKLIQKYPNNPEFKHSFGILMDTLNDPVQALPYLVAATEMDPYNPQFLTDLINTIGHFINLKMSDDKINEAEGWVNMMLTPSFNWRLNIEQKAQVKSMKIRLDGDIIVMNRLRDVSKKIDSIETNQNNNKLQLIEVLGIFSAVIAFILTSVNIITKVSDYKSVLLLLIGTGSILVLFVMAISLFFKPEKIKISKDFRFWFILLSLFIILALLIGIY